MEPSDARRLVRGAIDAARRRAAERRTRVDEASRAYGAFLSSTAVPAFQLMAQALSAEGQRFRVNTPGDSVRLVAEFSPTTSSNSRSTRLAIRPRSSFTRRAAVAAATC